MSTLRRFRTAICGVVLLLLLAPAASAQTGSLDLIGAAIEDARKQLAPDRRTTVFDVRSGGIIGGIVFPDGRTSEPRPSVEGEVHSAELKRELLAMLAKSLHYSVTDRIVALPSPDLGDKTRGVVSVSVANIRTKPDHAAEMATQAILGTPVSILKQDKGWYYVQTPDRYLGWTNDAITRMTPAEFEAWAAKPKVIVTTEVAFLRKTDKADAPVVSDVVAGAILAVTAKSSKTYAVAYPDGRTAVVPRALAQEYSTWLGSAHDTPDAIVATAKRFFGVPYLWGGTSVKGMDCSGFTKTVYFLNGVLLPRDASQQVEVGELIDTSAGIDLRVGDLLFFGTAATADRKERVTHVGISLGGKRFIHESTDVHINSLDPAAPDYSEYRATTFLRAKRIIGVGAGSGVLRLKDLPYYGVHHD